MEAVLCQGRRRFWGITCFFMVFATGGPVGGGAISGPVNLALQGPAAHARSWEPSVTVIAEHEPDKAIDGSLHSYWAVRADNLPADLGVEWLQPQKISSIVVRYFDGRMVRGPAVARTQQWARLQYWDHENWKDLDAQLLGQETSVVRYVFVPVTTTRVRLFFTEPPDPEFRCAPERNFRTGSRPAGRGRGWGARASLLRQQEHSAFPATQNGCLRTLRVQTCYRQVAENSGVIRRKR